MLGPDPSYVFIGSRVFSALCKPYATDRVVKLRSQLAKDALLPTLHPSPHTKRLSFDGYSHHPDLVNEACGGAPQIPRDEDPPADHEIYQAIERYARVRADAITHPSDLLIPQGTALRRMTVTGADRGTIELGYSAAYFDLSANQKKIVYSDGTGIRLFNRVTKETHLLLRILGYKPSAGCRPARDGLSMALRMVHSGCLT